MDAGMQACRHACLQSGVDTKQGTGNVHAHITALEEAGHLMQKKKSPKHTLHAYPVIRHVCCITPASYADEPIQHMPHHKSAWQALKIEMGHTDYLCVLGFHPDVDPLGLNQLVTAACPVSG